MIPRFRVFVLIVFFASVATADDFKTIDGTEYKKAKVSRVEPDGIVITFSGRIVKVHDKRDQPLKNSRKSTLLNST